MDPGQMHAFEKESLEDPFLMDALEGYGYGKDPESEIRDLERRISNRIQKRKSRLISLIKPIGIAATLVLLVGISFLLIKKQEGILPKVNPQVQTKSIPSPQELRQEEENPPQKQIHTISPPIINLAQKNSELSKNKGPEMDIKKERLLAEKEDRSAPNSFSKNDSVNAFKREETKVDLPGAISTLQSKDIIPDKNQSPVAKPATPVFSGTASALQGKVAGVSVSKDSGLNEVVVTGYGTKKKTATTGSVTRVSYKKGLVNQGDSSKGDFEPWIGRLAYKQYIDSAGKNAPANGTVWVQFRVSPNGNLNTFIIKASTDTLLNPLARKIIQEGPKWKGGNKNYKTRIERIVFYKKP